jgi:predicted HTH domain antitoxin
MSTARRLTVELPDGGLDKTDDAALAVRLRLLWVLDQVRQHAISAGRGAELAGLPTGAFLNLMGQHGISPFDYDESDLATELRSL